MSYEQNIRCPNCGEDRKFQIEKVVTGKRIEWYCNTCGKQFEVNNGNKK